MRIVMLSLSISLYILTKRSASCDLFTSVAVTPINDQPHSQSMIRVTLTVLIHPVRKSPTLSAPRDGGAWLSLGRRSIFCRDLR